MKIIPIDECCKTEYYLQFLGSVQMPQKTEYPAFSSIGFPKKQDMILFVDGCETRYQTISGNTISTQDGDVVYVPKGCQYRVECIKDSENSCTKQINFLLFDQDFNPFTFSDEVTVFRLKNPQIRSLFEKSIMLGKNASVYPSMQKAVLFEILSTLLQTDKSFSNSIIFDGIDYLHSHYWEDPPVSLLADICHVSNEYFRKLFKEQMGKSPTEYKNELRLKKAEQFLVYSDLPVYEISEQLSFATVSHFIKTFKDAHGCSPLAYRNSMLKR